MLIGKGDIASVGQRASTLAYGRRVGTSPQLDACRVDCVRRDIAFTMPLFWQFLILAVSLVVLYFGAETLVRGSSSLALRWGISPLVVGLTVVAFGTSAPELVVSISASLKGQGDLAMGNVVGSNILNIGIILGLTAVICPIKVSLPVIKLDAPIMLATVTLLAILALGGEVSRLMGGVFVLMLISYTTFNVIVSRRQATAEVKAEFCAAVPAPTGLLVRDLLLIGAGLALLVVGSEYLVDSAVVIARAFKLSEAVIGLTIVAAGTSMPELATSVVAALRRQPHIAIGNVVGSNIFNVLGVVGGAAMVKPLVAPGITVLDLGAMVAFSAGVLILMWSGRMLQRWEGAGLLLGYGVYLWARWPAV